MKPKNRSGWPKKYVRKNEDGSADEVADHGVLLKTRKIGPANPPLKVPELPHHHHTFIGHLKLLSEEISIRLKNGDHYPDQKPQMERLIKDIQMAALLFEDGYHDEAATDALRIGISISRFDFDHTFREFVQGKRNSESGAKQPRGLSPAWEAVRGAFVPGMKSTEGYKLYRKAGGKASPETFRKEFRLKFKK